MKWHALLLTSLLAVPVSAQSSDPPPAPPAAGEAEVKPKAKPTTRRSKVQRRAKEMRQNINKGRQVKSHVRVRVRLKNGNRLTGVVKDGRLVEKVDGLQFVDAKARDAGAGIRLWYSGGTRSYIFVPFQSLKNYEIVQRLSQRQVMQIENEMMMAEKRAEERKAREARRARGRAEGGDATSPAGAAPSQPPARPSRPGQPRSSQANSGQPAGTAASKAYPSKTGGTTGAQAGGDATAGGTSTAGSTVGKGATPAQQIKWLQLLRQYPPEQGWGEAKKGEIQRKFQVIGVPPTKVEQAFVDQYTDWLAACKHTGADPNAAANAKPKSKRELRIEARKRSRGTRN
ncbi:MAG: hypothetical protein AB8H80_12100 [Planctomycetota bacterium]